MYCVKTSLRRDAQMYNNIFKASNSIPKNAVSNFASTFNQQVFKCCIVPNQNQDISNVQ